MATAVSMTAPCSAALTASAAALRPRRGTPIGSGSSRRNRFTREIYPAGLSRVTPGRRRAGRCCIQTMQVPMRGSTDTIPQTFLRAGHP
jgi:hypothetical protein